jgi:hypothetical protein
MAISWLHCGWSLLDTNYSIVSSLYNDLFVCNRVVKDIQCYVQQKFRT